MKHYEYRDVVALEPHYSAHVAAMTSERLVSKSDIAAELAFRDQRIERLVQWAKEAWELVKPAEHSLGCRYPEGCNCGASSVNDEISGVANRFPK